MNLIKDTIQECFYRRIKETPQAVAYSFNEKEYSWAETGKIALALAETLRQQGIEKGQRVGLLSINSEAWLFYFFALQLVGAQPVLLNTALSDDEILRNIELTEVNYLYYGEGYHRNFDELIRRLSLICMRQSYFGSYKMNLLTDWKEVAHTTATETVAKGLPEDVCCFLFTSGTTKAAKAVMLTHYNLLNNAQAIAEAMHWQAEDRMCVAVPFFHCFGLTACILAGMRTGFPLYVLDHYRTIQVCGMIQAHRCTILNGVPSMFLAMRHNAAHKDYDLSSVCSGVIAGSPIFENDYYEICQMFQPKLHLQPSYGQTESSPCITIAGYDDDQKTKATTVGKPIDHVQLRIVDMDSGRLCEAGERGMIQTKGYHVMKGYYAMPEETAETITLDGWLITGDIGYLDEAGYLHIAGRKKNLIIRGGENISPEEIEYYLRQIDGVEQVKVLGVPAVVLQEEIAACIVSTRKDLTEEIIIAELKRNLADYKIPRYIFFLNEIDKLASGKIDEKKLREIVLEKVKQLSV